MEGILTSYYALSPAERTTETTAKPILSALLSTLSVPTQPEQIAPESRRKLITTLLATLSPLSPTPFSSTSSPSVLLPTLSLLKVLGRTTAGSEELAREGGLRTLLGFGGLSGAAGVLNIVPRDEEDDEENEEEEEEEEEDILLPHETEALRCLCNTLMLHPSARDTLRSVILEDDKDNDWTRGLVRILGMKGAGFLSGRILFFITSQPTEINQDLVENSEVLTELEKFVKRYLAVLRSPNSARLTAGPAPTSTDILREHLKMAYSLMLQYGRLPPSSLKAPTFPDSSEDQEDEEGASESALDSATPSRAPTPSEGEEHPLTKEAESVPRKLRKKIFGETKNVGGGGAEPSAPTSSSGARSSTPLNLAKKLVDAVSSSASSRRTKRPSPSPRVHMAASVPNTPSLDGGELSLFASQRFLPLFSPYVHLAALVPVGPDPNNPDPLLLSTLNVLLNFPIQIQELQGTYHSWLQDVPGAETYPELEGRGFAPLTAKVLELLGRTCQVWFPTEIVPEGVRGPPPVHPDELVPKGQGQASRIEEILGPLMLLLRKLSLLAEPAEQMRELLLPDNLDRSIPLEKRTDLLGHLIRLLSSILLPNTAYGVGELLYNLCNRDAATLSLQIGYGNACGFLQNRGELIPPPAANYPASSSSSSSTATGTGVGTKEKVKATEKEKEKGKGKGKEKTPSTSLRLASATAPATAPINPITGTYETPPDPDLVEMTPEEKEREAERLYVLFDRLEKSGVMEVANPVKTAKEAGRMQETKEEEEERRRELEREEEEDERAVEEELRAYRARKMGRNKVAEQ